MLRTRADVEPGQVWQSSDPRRLSSFRLVEVISDVVIVENLYPPRAFPRFLELAAFQVTGPKGYTRLS